MTEEIERKKKELEKKISKKSEQFTRKESAQPQNQHQTNVASNNNQMLSLILFVIEIFRNISKFQDSIDNDPSEIAKLVHSFFGPICAKSVEQKLTEEITNNAFDDEMLDDY